MRNKSKFLLLLAISLFTLSFSWFEDSSQQKKDKTSLLWKIEGNGLKNPSYLFGTMHLIQKEYFYFPAALEKIIKKSELVLTEIGLDKIGNQNEIMNQLYLKEGELTDFFSAEQQDTLFKWAKSKLMMDRETFLNSFGKMKPFVIVQTVIQLNFFGKTESYEMKIQEVASSHKIPFAGLETIAGQISLFDNLSREKQAQLVMENIRNDEKNIALMNQMQGIYRRQQLDSLYQLMENEGGVLQEEQNLFLDQRNLAWIAKIKETIAKNKTFIAVGAAHLAGEKGIIELLRKEGYTVTPVNF